MSRRRPFSILLVAMVLPLSLPAYAQAPHAAGDSGSPADVYSPRTSAVAAPMRVEVLNATSFVDVETRQVYRLYGIDACEAGQTATLGKQSWPCGVVATAWLVGATLNKWVACTPIRRQGAGSVVARCATGEMPDVAAEMLKTGYAVALPGPDDRLIGAYPQLEKDARAAYRGLWGSTFQMPWVYRQQQTQGQ